MKGVFHLCGLVQDYRTELRCVAGFQLCHDNRLKSHPALFFFSPAVKYSLTFHSAFPTLRLSLSAKDVICFRINTPVMCNLPEAASECATAVHLLELFAFFPSYCFGRGVDIPAGIHRIVSTCAAQCPLEVGVVASVTTGRIKECWPLTRPSGNPWHPLAADCGIYSLRKHICGSIKERRLSHDNHWI